MRGLMLLVCLSGVGAAGCSDTSAAQLHDGGDTALDFSIGTIAFHVASGAARVPGGVLSLYLTNQPDACLAVTQAAVGTVVVLTLKVAAQTDGTTTASVVAPRTTPLPGQATGELDQLVGGAITAAYPAASGSIAWTLNSDGSYGLGSMDVGFSGAEQRMQLGGLRLTTCP